MPETRKHKVVVRNELDRAIYDALGEPVRPVEPGTKVPAAEAGPELPAATDLGGVGSFFIVPKQ